MGQVGGVCQYVFCEYKPHNNSKWLWEALYPESIG